MQAFRQPVNGVSVDDFVDLVSEGKAGAKEEGGHQTLGKLIPVLIARRITFWTATWSTLLLKQTLGRMHNVGSWLKACSSILASQPRCRQDNLL
jgi:hypothetical protein